MQLEAIHLHSMVKNEELFLQKVIPIWKEYPVDKYVFLDDGSTDRTIEVIQDLLGLRAVVLHRPFTYFHEAANRQTMLDYSFGRAEWVLALDADEILTSGFFDSIEDYTELLNGARLEFYCFNVCNEGRSFRQDPAYVDNYLTFLFAPQSKQHFDLNRDRYHSSKRYPKCDKSVVKANSLGVIHLQAFSKDFYLLKQLWYKHFEYIKYSRDITSINRQYDYVVNGGDFREVPMPKHLAVSLDLHEEFFGEIELRKGYKSFIRNHFNRDLCTFGSDLIG
jgi:glycosyltransferase involved in cell wall biosynthesis